MAEKLEAKLGKAVGEIARDVKKMREILYDVGMKLNHVIERKLDYHTLPLGLSYDEGYTSSG